MRAPNDRSLQSLVARAFAKEPRTSLAYDSRARQHLNHSESLTYKALLDSKYLALGFIQKPKRL